METSDREQSSTLNMQHNQTSQAKSAGQPKPQKHGRGRVLWEVTVGLESELGGGEGSRLAACREALGPCGVARRRGEAGGGWRRRERRGAELLPSMALSGGGGSRNPARSARSQSRTKRTRDAPGPGCHPPGALR
jgi:hypothetical protein